jgi:hypothetical protein
MAMYNPLIHCHGLFRGNIPFPFPLPCDTIHFILGILSGILPLHTQILSVLTFIVYQAIEELHDWNVRSFLKDVGIFLTGYLFSESVWWLVQHAHNNNKKSEPIDCATFPLLVISV